jgi:hypothetical protein
MRQVMLTLGHVPARLFRRSLEAVYRTRRATDQVFRYFLYHYYPVNERQNRIELYRLCAEYDIRVLDPGRNLGVHEGLNYVAKEIGLTRHDVLLTVDPDTNPITPGWDRALLSVVAGNSDIGWAFLTNSQTPSEIRARPGGYTERTLANGTRLYVMHGPAVASISAWQMQWVLDSPAGGFHEPCKWYGHIESAMYPDLVHAGKRLAVLRDYAEDDAIKADQDKIYAEWKSAHAFEGYPLNFPEFVERKYPDLLTSAVPAV